MQHSYVKVFKFSSVPCCVFYIGWGTFTCVVGKYFDTARAAVDLPRERKGINKVTVGELTLISRSLYKISAAFPPSSLKISCNFLAILTTKGKEQLQWNNYKDANRATAVYIKLMEFRENKCVVVFGYISVKVINWDETLHATYYCTHASIYFHRLNCWRKPWPIKSCPY